MNKHNIAKKNNELNEHEENERKSRVARLHYLEIQRKLEKEYDDYLNSREFKKEISDDIFMSDDEF